MEMVKIYDGISFVFVVMFDGRVLFYSNLERMFGKVVELLVFAVCMGAQGVVNIMFCGFDNIVIVVFVLVRGEYLVSVVVIVLYVHFRNVIVVVVW